MRCSKSPTKRKPSVVNACESPDGGENHQMRQWLEVEVRSQLIEIDRKLAELSDQVDRCLSSFTGLNDMQKTCEKLLGKLPEKVPLSGRSNNSSRAGKSSARSNSGKRSRSDLPPPVPEADPQENQDNPVRAEPFNGELTPLLQKTPWSDQEGSPDVGLSKLTRNPTMVLNKGKNVRRGWWVENVTNFLDDPESSRAASLYDRVRTPLIFLSVCLTLSQTIDPEPLDRAITRKAETCIDAFCALEIATRFLFAPSRCAFFLNTYNIIDILTAVPLLVRASIGFESPRAQKLD